MFISPGPVAFNLGSFQVYWYGVIIALAFYCGLGISVFIARQLYANNKKVVDNLFDLSTIVLIGAIIGARLYYVVFNFDYFSLHLNEIPMVWYGGLSIHGALIGGFLTGSIYSVKNKLSVFKYADLIAFGLICGQAIGRWGNFFNSEAFGKPTNLPWKLYIPLANRPEQYLNYEFFHPTFLYEFIWNILVFIILYFGIKDKFYKYKGVIFFSYLIFYSIGRIIIENIRIDSVYNFLSIPIAQWASIILILTGSIGIFICLKRGKDN